MPADRVDIDALADISTGLDKEHHAR